jgi:hypothetical protein
MIILLKCEVLSHIFENGVGQILYTVSVKIGDELTLEEKKALVVDKLENECRVLNEIYDAVIEKEHRKIDVWGIPENEVKHEIKLL